MDLFELVGSIVIKNDDANREIDNTTNKADKSEGTISRAFGAIGRGAAVAGKVIMTGLAVGGAAMTGLTIKALNLSGELEQNMGGSEAVFKSYAGKMQETAKQAFSNMGLSTSDFLATANKMGALFQGAGFSIEESSDMASDAMQRAADVASIMGIDTSAAMEAIAGAAKGNFTMMDNLGVAMNDTTIQAYALSKGIDKSTSEMTNQEKIALAMEMFMEKTAYAAGNYAKENETLAGSLGTAKAALTNFLDGSGDVDQLVTAFSNAANVIVQNIGEIAPRLVNGITDIINQVIPMLPPLLDQLLPVIIEGAINLINGLVAAIPGIISALMKALPSLIDGIVKIVDAVIRALPQIISELVKALPKLIPQLVNGLVSLIVTVCEMLPEIIQPIIEALPGIIITLFEALLQNLPIIIEALVTLVTSLIEMLPELIPVLIDMLIQLIYIIVEQLPVIIPLLIDACITIVQALIQALPDILLALIEALPAILKAVWDAIVMIFTELPAWFGQLFQGAVDIIKTVFSAIGEFFAGIWEIIKGAFSAVISWFGDIFSKAWEGIKSAFAAVGNFFSGIWSTIKGAFSAVIEWFGSIFTKAWEGIKKAFSAVGNFFTGIWDSIKSIFSKVGSAIADAVSGAFKKAVNWVLEKAIGIINGFISAINAAIGLINLIPGVNISKIKKLNVPKLAEGGVVDKPTPAVFGEDGPETVIPLKDNATWIRNVAKQIHEFTVKTRDDFTEAFSVRTLELQEQQVSELRTLTDKVDSVIGLLVQFFPEALEAMRTPMVCDTNGLTIAMAPMMNEELGRLAIKKGRGR